MRTYITSLHHTARYAHIGNLRGTACGYVFVTSFYVSDNVPADRTVCPRCSDVADGIGAAATRYAAWDAAILALLKEGHDLGVISQMLRSTRRTVGRHAAAARRKAGARTFFEWGYKVGLAERPA